jgi:hypothetical protein
VRSARRRAAGAATASAAFALILWRVAGVSLASGWTLAAARPSAAAAALAHLLELLLLVGGEDLCQLGVDFFLQLLDLRLLIGVEIELILQGGRKDLAGLGGHASPSGAAWTTGATLVTTATAGALTAFAALATTPAWAGVAFKACVCRACARRCGSLWLGNRGPGKRRNAVDRDGQERGQRFLHGGFLRLG